MQKRYRLKFSFWLNINDALQEQIADAIEILKTQRLFSKTIRDGIRLVHDLRQGSLDVLFDLFPYVKSEFLKYVQEAVGQVQSVGDIDKAHDAYQHTQYLKEVITLQNEEIERLTVEIDKLRRSPSEEFEDMIQRAVEKAVAKNTPQPRENGHPSDLRPVGGLRPIAGANNVADPVFDDDEDLELAIGKDTSNIANKNFLKAVFALVDKE